MELANTKELLLEEAEKLIRTRGYAAFSYAHLSELVGIQKASIHYHFPTKEALGSALIDAYLVRFQEDLQHVLDSAPTVRERLRRYSNFFAASMNSDLLPLCGALAAEMSILPRPMQERVRYFFGLHLKWLHAVLAAGVASKELREDLDIDAAARLILSTLEGASLVAWATGDGSMILNTVQDVVTSLERPASSNGCHAEEGAQCMGANE